MDLARENSNEKRLTLGLFLACIYIFFTYIAKGSILSENYTRVSLYLFLVWAVFNVIKNNAIIINSYNKWYFCFFCLCSFSIIYADNKLRILESIYPLLVILGVTFAFMLVIKKKSDYIIIFWAYSLSATLLIIILLLTNQLYMDVRLGSSLFGNANAFAHFFAVSVVCSIWLFIYSKRSLKIFALACIISQIYALALSGGRKSFVFPFIFLYTLLLLKKDKTGRKHIVKYTIIFIIIVVIVYYMVMNIPALYESLGNRMESLLNLFTGEGTVDNSTLVRQKMIKIGLKGWLDKPFLGHGVDNYKYWCFRKLNRLTYAHNNFVEVIFDLGIVGFILYYGFYAFLLKKLISVKQAENYDLRNFFISFVIALVIFEYGAITYNEIYVQVILAMGTIHLAKEKGNKVNSE